MEVWKDVNGFEGLYMISNKGRLKRLETTYYREKDGKRCLLKEKILNPKSVTKRGYLRTTLSKMGKTNCKKNMFIHVLVAKAFIPNKNNFPFVNHIDGNKKNNCVENLEWCDNRYNVLHSYRDKHMIHNNAIAVIQYNDNMEEINRFQTIRQAMECTGCERKYIRKAMLTEKKYKNYFWREWDRKEEFVYA